jgi:trimeric autotransporter adhesin
MGFWGFGVLGFWGTAVNDRCNCVYVAWSTVSDARDKTNIKSLSEKHGLALITKLRPVTFHKDHRDNYVRECSYEYGQKDGKLAGTKEHYGLIAQEIKSALEELNVKFDGLGYDPEKDAYRVTYEELIAPIIKAIQELNTRLEVVEEKVG